MSEETHGDTPPPLRLLDCKQVAAFLGTGITPRWVSEHRDEFGGFKIGSRLRFDEADVLAAVQRMKEAQQGWRPASVDTRAGATAAHSQPLRSSKLRNLTAEQRARMLPVAQPSAPPTKRSGGQRRSQRLAQSRLDEDSQSR